MNLKETLLPALVGAVAGAILGFPSTYYFARQRTLQETQQRQEQEKRQASNAEKQNLEELTRLLESMRFALEQSNVVKFREEALAYAERRSRHEFDVATESKDFAHPNPLKGEADVLDLDLTVYATLLNRRPVSKSEGDSIADSLFGEESLLRVTVGQVAKDARSRVIVTR